MMQFTIVLPVRNGFPYIEECVDSILAQTYPHFELVILDSGSTDGTVAWASKLTDPRVRVQASDRPLSIEESWGRIRDLRKEEYLTLIGHDDVFDPRFLEIIAALVRSHPDASLYHTGSRLIDSAGRTIRRTRDVAPRETAADYMTSRFRHERDVFGTGYVMRSADYDRVGGIPGFEKLYFSDDALWLMLTQLAWKASDPTEAFAVRIHSESDSASLPNLWPSTLRALGEFAEFLEGFVEKDETLRDVHRRLAPEFFLRYHRNTYIYALIEASQRRERIDPDVARRMEASLGQWFPETRGRLRGSRLVQGLELMNRTPARAVMGRLWNAYQRVRK